MHAWIYVPETGRHYDSEAPVGVTDYMDLPFFARWLLVHRLERVRTIEEEARGFKACAALWAKTRTLISSEAARRKA